MQQFERIGVAVARLRCLFEHAKRLDKSDTTESGSSPEEQKDHGEGGGKRR